MISLDYPCAQLKPFISLQAKMSPNPPIWKAENGITKRVFLSFLLSFFKHLSIFLQC